MGENHHHPPRCSSRFKTQPCGHVLGGDELGIRSLSTIFSQLNPYAPPQFLCWLYAHSFLPFLSTAVMTAANMSCPSGGSFYACGDGSKFVGCCEADPVSRTKYGRHRARLEALSYTAPRCLGYMLTFHTSLLVQCGCGLRCRKPGIDKF
jgi:hypothetical protein